MSGDVPGWSPDGPTDPRDRPIDHVVTDLRRSTLIAATARCRSMLASAMKGPWVEDHRTWTAMVAREEVIIAINPAGTVTLSVETDMEPTRFEIDLRPGIDLACATTTMLRTLRSLADAMDDPAVMSTEHALAPWYSALAQMTAAHGAAWTGAMPTPWCGFTIVDDMGLPMSERMPSIEIDMLDRALPLAVMVRTMDHDGPHLAMDPVVIHDPTASGRRDPMSTMRRLTILKDRIDAMDGRKDRTDDGRPEWRA